MPYPIYCNPMPSSCHMLFIPVLSILSDLHVRLRLALPMYMCAYRYLYGFTVTQCSRTFFVLVTKRNMKPLWFAYSFILLGVGPGKLHQSCRSVSCSSWRFLCTLQIFWTTFCSAGKSQGRIACQCNSSLFLWCLCTHHRYSSDVSAHFIIAPLSHRYTSLSLLYVPVPVMAIPLYHIYMLCSSPSV